MTNLFKHKFNIYPHWYSSSTTTSPTYFSAYCDAPPAFAPNESKYRSTRFRLVSERLDSTYCLSRSSSLTVSSYHWLVSRLYILYFLQLIRFLSLSLSLYIVWPEFLARQVNRKHSCGYRFSLAIYDTYCNTCTFIHSSFSLHRLPSFFTCIHTYIFICIVLYIYIIHIYI